MTQDGISDTWIKKTDKWYLINDLWKKDTMSKLQQIFEARLVPLNKKYPDIPSYEEFRPIAILSHLFKYLELRFMEKIQNYLLNKMDKRQNGFVRGIGTSPNIKLLINQIRNSKKSDGKCTIFIDFKSAYNTVLREKLYEALEYKNILSKNEIQFLRALHANLHFRV